MTPVELRDCPTAETQAAFIDGTGSDEERQSVQRHLETCPTCMRVLRETARFEREELESRGAAGAANLVPMRRAPAWWMAVAAGLVIAIVGGYAIWQIRPRDPLRNLYAAAARVDYRPVEGRLHGMEFRPVAPTERSGSIDDETPATLRLRGAAGELLEKSAGSEDASALHAAGVARLVTGNERQAVEHLEAATAKQTNNASYWSDLAAARLSQGKADGDPHSFALALAAADRALRIDPRLSDALFNRAVALNFLNFYSEAADAYRTYLEVDGQSLWAAEVRDRLRRLENKSSSDTWKDAMRELPAADPGTTMAIVRRFPQEARKWGEGIFLGQWAEAVLAGRGEEAETKLSISRSLGTALAKVNGEHLLGDSVAVIDQANVEKRRELARAQVIYQEGRVKYDQRNVSQALKPLSDAADQFRTLGSPMAASAAYYHANALHDSNRSGEALTAIRDLLASVPERHRGLRAHLRWQEGSVLGSLGKVVESVAAFKSSAEIFHSLGETSNAALMDQWTGFGYSSTGRRLDAWRAYLRVFPALGTNDNARIGSLMAMSRAEIAEEHWDVARSLSGLGLAIKPQTPNPRRETHLWLQRVMADLHRDPNEAFEDLRHATKSADRIEDEGLRQAAMFDIRFLEATLSMKGQPDRAVQLLSANIDWARAQKLLIRLPEQYLERSRAQLAGSDTKRASADIREALSLIETRGSTLLDTQARASLMASLDSAVEENVDALLRDQRLGQAFSLAEQSKGRIFSSGQMAEEALRKGTSLPENVIVAHYLSLPDSTVIFTLDRNGLVAYRQGISRVELDRMVEGLRTAIAGGVDTLALNHASQLFDVLVLPFSDRLVPNGKLIVVPDGAVARVPFAALRDARLDQYLVERTQVQFAPSAGWYLRKREAVARPQRREALVVGNPAFDRQLLSDLPSLPAAGREASEVSEIYGTVPLAGSAATTRRILSSLSAVGVFHFAGHAVVNEAEPRNSFLACAREHDESGLLYLSDIEQLSLDGLDLAVLAGCRTAGAMGGSRHPQSVALAFLRAGARGTVGSLWNLDDEATREISIRLHQRFAEGAALSEALRDSQLEFLRRANPSLKDLRIWAGYQAWGS